MASNIGLDDGHPYVESGADEAHIFRDGHRLYVEDELPPATASVTLERLVDGAWEPVVETTTTASMVDWESPSYGDLEYRTTAFSADGAATVTTFIVEARSAALWLSGGPGFAVTARLPFDPGVSITAGRARTLKQWAGRSLPVAVTGEAVSRTVAVSGTIQQRTEDGALLTAEVEQLTAVAQLPDARFMFRDPDGRRIYGSIGQVSLPRGSAFVDEDGHNALWAYSFTLTETEEP